MFKLFYFYNHFIFNLKNIKNTLINSIIFKSYFFSNYYLINELVWQEGLLIDFLQKKIIDNWVKKFLIYSANLFNERLVFDKVIRFYLDLIIWPMHKLFIFEFNNISNTLFINIFSFFLFFFIVSLFYMFSII